MKKFLVGILTVLSPFVSSAQVSTAPVKIRFLAGTGASLQPYPTWRFDYTLGFQVDYALSGGFALVGALNYDELSYKDNPQSFFRLSPGLNPRKRIVSLSTGGKKSLVNPSEGIVPYVSGALGLSYAFQDSFSTTNQSFQYVAEKKSDPHLSISVAFGSEFRLSKRWFASVEGGVSWVTGEGMTNFPVIIARAGGGFNF